MDLPTHYLEVVHTDVMICGIGMVIGRQHHQELPGGPQGVELSTGTSVTD